MPLKRHLETIKAYKAQGNQYCADKVAEFLLRTYSRKADKAKILEALNG